MKFVPATREMLERYYGFNPRPTVRVQAMVENGEILGVGGMSITRNRMVVFVSMKEELRERMRKYPRALVRKVLELQDYAKRKGLVLQAEPDKTIPCSLQFLARLGFEKVSGTEVYIWR